MELPKEIWQELMDLTDHAPRAKAYEWLCDNKPDEKLTLEGIRLDHLEAMLKIIEDHVDDLRDIFTKHLRRHTWL